MKVFYSPNFEADIGDHVMPIRKFSAVAEALRAGGLPIALCTPSPVSDEQLLYVHTPDYVEAVGTGSPRALAESQKQRWVKSACSPMRQTWPPAASHM